MSTLFTFQSWLLSALGVLLLGAAAFAFVDCARTRADAFPAADRRTKGLWLALTGVATAIAIIFVTNPLGLPGLLAAVAAGVYLADVRPAVKMYRSRRPRGGTW